MSTNGEILWQNTDAPDIRTLAVDKAAKMIYAGSNNGYLYAIDRNGEITWATKLDSPVSSIKLAERDGVTEKIIAGTDRGDVVTDTVYALSPNGLILWQNTDTSNIMALAVDNTNDRTYAGSRNGNVYAIDNSNGDFIWTKQIEEGATVSSIELADKDGVTEKIIVGTS